LSATPVAGLVADTTLAVARKVCHRTARFGLALSVAVALGVAGCASTSDSPPAAIYTGGSRIDPVPPSPIPSSTGQRPPTGPTSPLPLPPPVVAPPPPPKPVGYVPPFMEGRPVVQAAVLLPFGSSDARIRAEAEGLLASIEMALFDSGATNILLLPKDVGDTPRQAAEVARLALADGADVILGPLRADNVRAAAAEVAQSLIPLIGFSNDRSAASTGAMLLSFPPEEEIDRVVDWATRQGVTHFALLGPDSAYGRRVQAALEQSATLRATVLAGAEFYGPDANAKLAAARRLKTAIEGQARSRPRSVAVLLPESGVNLKAVAPLMAYTGLENRFVRLIGTGQWSDQSTWNEPTLAGGAFAAPDPAALAAFEARFQTVFGRKPSRLASLGYDAALLAFDVVKQKGDAISKADLMNPEGFIGVDGLFRFRGDGTVERGFAILQVAGGQAQVVDAAPQSFRPGGS